MNGSRESGRGAVLRFIITKAPSAAIGVVAAVATVVGIDHFRDGAVAATADRKTGGSGFSVSGGDAKVTQRVVVDDRAFGRIAELERQVREMQEAKAATASSTTPSDQSSPDPADVRRQLREMYAQLDRDHERDSADSEWAPAAARDLVSGLTALGDKAGFNVGPTDCKTTTCRATVTWSNYSLARATGAQLVEHLFGALNCTQRINLQEPADPTASYSANLYLDCADLRAGLADEITAK
jgi:hypothetical protein